jgi:hypothetical protein
MSKKRAAWHRVMQPSSKLHLMVDRPNGMLRTAAIAEAGRRVELQRGAALKAIELLVDQLEALTFGVAAISPSQLGELSRICDQLINHAQTYHLDAAALAAKMMCDMIGTLKKLGEVQSDPVLVHVRALRLLTSRENVPAQVSESVLAELRKVLSHLDTKLAASGV